jgi:predicted RND superfamily exporter protein
MSERLARFVVRRAGVVLVLSLLVSAALVPVVLRIRLDTDIVKLVPAGQSEAQAFARFARAFVAEQVLIVLAEGDDPTRLRAFADELGARLQKEPGVAEVRWRLGRGAADFVKQHLLQLLTVEEIAALGPQLTPEALAARAQRLRGIVSAPGGSSLAPILTADPLELLGVLGKRLSSGLPVDTTSGYFQSADGRAVLLYVRPRGSTFDVEADRALIARTSAIAAALGARVTDGVFTGAPGAIEVGYTGACAYTLTYRDWLHADASWSTPLSAIAVLLLFGLVFRSFRVLVLVALPLGVGLLWTVAAAVGLFRHVNAVSLTFGTVLLSIGIDIPIQIYNRLREELAAGEGEGEVEPLGALERTITQLAFPSLLATLGPAIVFFACVLSEYRGLSELGVLSGVGLCLNLIAMLTLFPALMATLPPSWWARRERGGVQAQAARGEARGVLAAVGRFAAARPRVVLAVVGVVTAAMLPLALRVRFDERLITIHPPSMPPVRTEAELSRRFGERERMLVALVEEADPERALERADAWAQAGEALRARGVVRGFQSISSLFPSKKTQEARRAAWAKLDPERAARALEAALAAAGFDTEPFAPFLASLRGAATAPDIRLEEAKGSDLAFIVSNHVQDEPGLRRVATLFFAAPPPAGEGARAALVEIARGEAGGVVTGSPVLEEVLRTIVIRDTRLLTIVSTLGVALLLLVAYRRGRPWLAVILPLAVAWVLFGAALALFDLPLNLFNLLCVPLVIGYGIDDHVFVVARHEASPGATPALTLARTGRAVVVTSLATIAGFAGLAIARFDGLRLFGTTGVLAVFFCLAAVFLVLPALLALLYRDTLPPRKAKPSR